MGTEHWTTKGDVRLFLWEKAATPSPGSRGTILFVHGYARLPNPDKQFAVMPGIAHASFHQKNFRIAYHLLHNFFQQPAPIYRGENI